MDIELTSGEIILACRNGLNMSQQTLAVSLGVSRSCIALWETCQTVPRIQRLNSIVRALSMTDHQRNQLVRAMADAGDL